MYKETPDATEKKIYRFTIELLDFWQVGSGLTGGVSVDSLVLKDNNSLPHIPGKVLKGLIKELAEECLEECFGKEGIGEALASVFSNAELGSDTKKEIADKKLGRYLYRKITTTSMDSKKGIAKNDTLRSAEVVVPIQLHGTISCSDNCKSVIENAMKRLKRLGMGRNRGFGRCKMVLRKEIERDDAKKSIENSQKQFFKCTFLNDIVLPGSSNTEGRQQVLDFIPGSAVLGIVAGAIKKGKINLDFETLLNGSIRFNDSTLLVGDEPAYRIPFSYFQPKIADENSKPCYNHPFITEKEHDDYQMVQLRSGYMTKDGKQVDLQYNYEQKSANSKKSKAQNREQKSANSKKSKAQNRDEMYGYSAITKGTQWLLSVEGDDGSKVKEISNYLLDGRHRIGKSKSAQYGEVKFELFSDSETWEKVSAKSNKTLALLYVKSRLMLIDKKGQPTFEPTSDNLGLSSGEIDWEHTQIRTTSYTPYVGSQKSRSFERIIIEKGSVIAIENPPEDLPDTIRVGSLWAEGFGEMVVDPAFLWEQYPRLEKHIVNPVQVDTDVEKDENLINYLTAQKSKRDLEFEMIEKIEKVESGAGSFSDKITNAQWGVLRSFATNPDVADVRDKIEIFISHGKNKSMWEERGDEKKLLDLLDEVADKKLFIKLLASYKQQQGRRA